MKEGNVCVVMRKAGEIPWGVKDRFQESRVYLWVLTLVGICALQEVSQFLRASVSLPKNLD